MRERRRSSLALSHVNNILESVALDSSHNNDENVEEA